MEFTSEFLAQVPRFLSPDGALFLLVIGDNDFEAPAGAILLGEREVPGELQLVYKIQYPK
jgi:hypothetical protein